MTISCREAPITGHHCKIVEILAQDRYNAENAEHWAAPGGGGGANERYSSAGETVGSLRCSKL